MIRVTRLISLLALAASLSLSEATDLDVWSPPIKVPNSNTVWSLKERYHLVKWDTSNPPQGPHGTEITNTNGRVLLVRNNLLDVDHPMAEGFNILDGKVEVHLPRGTKPGKYMIALLGDSGNWSDKFTVVE